jgi:hypothetical protein
MKCEDVILAAMVIIEGETPALSPAQVSAHLAECADCRQEVEELKQTIKLFDSQIRSRQEVDLWPSIHERLESTEQRQPAVGVFIGIGLLLVIYKLVEMVPERDLGLLFKLVPILFVVVAFGLLKVNPFKISMDPEAEEGAR